MWGVSLWISTELFPECIFMREKRQGTKEQVHSVTDPSPWTLQSTEIDKRSDDNFRQSFMGAGATIQGSENEKQVPWLAPRGKLLGLLKGLTMWVVHELVRGSSLEVIFPPLWWCCVQGTGAVPCFCSRHLRNGRWFVAFLYLIVHNCSNCEGVQLCLVCYSFFVFCCSRRCVSRWKHSSKGSQVPTYQNRVLFFV